MSSWLPCRAQAEEQQGQIVPDRGAVVVSNYILQTQKGQIVSVSSSGNCGSASNVLVRTGGASFQSPPLSYIVQLI